MKVPEKFRRTHPTLGKGEGNNGFFVVIGKNNTELRIISSDGMGWEHVSVSTTTRCPTWDEMCLVKNLFWEEEELVVQFHPPKNKYINNHPYCLHLWNPIGKEIPIPDTLLIGYKV